MTLQSLCHLTYVRLWVERFRRSNNRSKQQQCQLIFFGVDVVALRRKVSVLAFPAATKRICAALTVNVSFDQQPNPPTASSRIPPVSGLSENCFHLVSCLHSSKHSGIRRAVSKKGNHPSSATSERHNSTDTKDLHVGRGIQQVVLK